MTPLKYFHFCPRCGARQSGPPTVPVFQCGGCGFRYFFNPAVAIAVFIRREDGKVLFIRRAKDPGRGKLAPPGGFIDFGETAEEAAAREIREEVGLELGNLEFLCSQPNSYHYAEVTYPVLDLFFTAQAIHGKVATALDDVASLGWFTPESVTAEKLAFPSMQAAWRHWRRLEGNEFPNSQ